MSTKDSAELEALFEATAALNRPIAANQAALCVGEATSDSDELQALFDRTAHIAATPSGLSGTSDEGMFEKIGKMTRTVHETLQALGVDAAMRELADSLPDTRERLNYIAHMTEQAASRVLNAVDIATPLQTEIQTAAAGLGKDWDRVFAGAASTEEFVAVARRTKEHLALTQTKAGQIHTQLQDIMMAQDFQDLTGQVIKKVVEMAQSIERQLCDILIEFAPAQKKESALLNGPVISTAHRDDVVTGQEQVDDLLASLGF